MSEHDTDPGIIKGENPAGAIQFNASNIEVMRFCPDGTVLVRGEKVDDNREVYAAFLTWMRDTGALRRYHGNPNPLVIEIHDPRNIVVLDGSKQLACIHAMKFEAAIDRIPPILEVEVPSVVDSMGQDLKDAIAATIEAVQRHGGQVTFRAPQDYALASDADEQRQAENTIREAFLTPKQ